MADVFTSTVWHEHGMGGRACVSQSRLCDLIPAYIPGGVPQAYLVASHEWHFAQALWVQFTPDAKVADPDTWAMSKLGSLVSPLDVVRNGSHSLHAVDDDGVLVNALGYTHSWEQLKIRCPHSIIELLFSCVQTAHACCKTFCCFT